MVQRVVVTGLGTVNSLGLSVEEYWNNLAAGRSGVKVIDRFDVSTLGTKIAGLVPDFDWLPLFKDQKMAKRLDRCTILAYAAGKQAYADCGLKEGEFDPLRVGCIIGTGMGGVKTFEDEVAVKISKGHKRISPFFVPMLIPNTVPAYFAIDHNFKGPNFTIITACAAASHSMGEAFEIIRRGDADMIFTGGAEACVTEQILAGFGNMKALSTRNDEPEKASRPFDKDRDGFVMAEGAAVLVLESLESAQKRGAKIYAEMVGFGMSCDAYHITAPHPEGEGGYNAMMLALKKSGLRQDEIDLVNAHGTSTPLGDIGETKAIKRCFGEHVKNISVHSTKSMLGHCLGAAGAVEAVAGIQALVQGIVHPTINLENPDPECDLHYVPHTAEKREVRAFLSNSFGFGGHNASVIFKSWRG